MRLVQTQSKTESAQGSDNTNGSARASDTGTGHSKNLVDHLLTGKSARILSYSHSGGSSLDIKVNGGAKKTTPPPVKKEIPQKANGRTKRKRSSSSQDYDDIDYYQNYGDDTSGRETYVDGSAYDGDNNIKYKDSSRSRGQASDDAKTGDRAKASRSEEKKGHRRKHYDDNSYSSKSSWSKGVSSSEGPDDLEIPVGQWIVILCAVVGIAYHYFNLGQKIPTLLKGSKSVKVSKKKDHIGKRPGIGSRKGKKRGQGTKNRGAKASPAKKFLTSSDTGTEFVSIGNESPNKVPVKINTGTAKKTIVQKKVKKASSNSSTHVAEEIIHESHGVSKKSKKKKTKKNNRNSSRKNHEDTNTPDSVSTDGSSSTEDVNNNYNEDQIPSLEFEHDEKPDDSGEWTVVGGPPIKKTKSPQNDTAKEKISLENDTPSKSETSSSSNEEKEVDLKPSVDGVKEIISSNEVEDKVAVLETNDTEAELGAEPTSSLVTQEEKEEAKTDNKMDNEHIDAVPNTENDDAAYARLLQKEEEEMAAASNQIKKNTEEGNWEEVSKKKKGKKQ